MSYAKIPITEIIVEDRQRKDLGNIDDLATSLRTFGLIQPIVLNQSKCLIAGGRRLAAAKQNGWTDIAFVFRETLSNDELAELELEENIRRKALTWQENCLAISKIHFLKRRAAVLGHTEWGQRETGEMLGLSKGHIGFSLTMAKELSDPQSPAWSYKTFDDAWKAVIMFRNEQAALQELYARDQAIQKPSEEEIKEHEEVKILSANPDLLVAERERYYSNPHNSPGSFENYWNQRQATVSEANRTIYLTNRLYCCDAIEFMSREENQARFDHIITDPDYGIPTDMMDQQNQGMVDIVSVDKEHGEDHFTTLFSSFFLWANTCLKEHGYLILWCDEDYRERLKTLAQLVGFKVQRWSFVWCKTSPCMNNAAQYNFTKKTEIALVCRKGNATLINPGPQNYVIAANGDDITIATGHPFAKPFAVWEPLINAVSFKGQTIYEPFAGGGSGVLSLLKLERNVVATEINQSHYVKLVENVKNHYRKLNPDFVFK